MTKTNGDHPAQVKASTLVAKQSLLHQFRPANKSQPIDSSNGQSN
ncbi:hypothetical protein COLO4_35539 [Corchorus olitorius]|uniref:Uncharacterized protein n=1 Tax=Corchorus olitorius TaxID=93759 RepID=A0A1R3GFN5_9ROSI|nr:hypothetical protein COLO4_35539 [Corchorus olitorius]